jgi:hypothetical protein
MTEESALKNDVSGPQFGPAAMPRERHAVPLLLCQGSSGALHRDTHYDWMDFHSMPGLPQEW